MQLRRITYYSLADLHVSSDIFAHRQEHLNCITASGIAHVCRCRMVSWALPMIPSGSQGIMCYPTQLHLVGHFSILYHDARKHVYNACLVCFLSSYAEAYRWSESPHRIPTKLSLTV
jgi:hypothetical protein